MDLIKKLKDALPPHLLITDREECMVYASDWTKMEARPLAVTLPKTVEEVATILRLCTKLGIPVVPSGGRTGLAGGAVARGNELVVNLSRMNRLHHVDEIGRSVRVQAGVTTQAVHEHCAEFGLTWPIDLAAKGSSQIGGNLSTNAGGVRVIRYGMARKWVTALQAVTMAGDVLELNHGLEKNNTGYDLIQLILGSEGTLAIITEATLKLVRVPSESKVFFFSLKKIRNAQDLFQSARRAPFEILAFEFFSSRCLAAVEKRLGRTSRLTSGGDYYALLEIESRDNDATLAWLETVLAEGVVNDGLMAETSELKSEVWALREGITESLSHEGLIRKYDVSVPVARGVEFLERIESLFSAGHFKSHVYLFGHLGDGSPHLNVLSSQHQSAEQFQKEGVEFETSLFALLGEFHGSVSAEHGVGLLKKHWLTYSRSKEELRIFRAIKAAFDPKGLLNPGKVLDVDSKKPGS